MNCKGRDAVSGEWIEIEFDRVITHVNPVLDSVDRADTFVSSGFIDLQINGFAGVDFNSPEENEDDGAADLDRALRSMFSTGVTRCFPTLITGSPETILARLRELTRAREALKKSPAHGSAVEGFHIEGPHISSEDRPRGAHPKQWVRPPDIEEFRRWQDAAQGLVRIVTVAPEWPGITSYIDDLTREGVVVSIGHTRASAEQIHDAVLAGATMSTHLGNGAGSKDRRDDFITQQLAETKLTASFIVDGHHLPQEFLLRALEAKGIERSVLVTDAVAPAMCEPGPYTLGEVGVDLKTDGRVMLRIGERLAGSTLRMDHAIMNVMRQANLTLAQAIVMATTNPARAGRVSGRIRGIQPGQQADLVRFRIDNGKLTVIETFLNGQTVFQKMD